MKYTAREAICYQTSQILKSVLEHFLLAFIVSVKIFLWKYEINVGRYADNVKSFKYLRTAGHCDD